MGEDAQQGVAGQRLLAREQHQHHGQKGTDQRDAEVEVRLEGRAQRNAQQGRVRQGVPEVGHAAPHHETAQGAGHQCHHEPAGHGTPEEVVQDQVDHGTVSPCRS